MAQTIRERVAEAKQVVTTIDTDAAAKLVGQSDVIFVDVRDSGEVAQSGKISGALNISRGMLEFKACESSPGHDPNFTKDKSIVVYCGTGGRSALSAKSLMDLGFEKVHDLGAFKDWVDKGLPTER